MQALIRFINHEATAGFILVVAAAAALIVSNNSTLAPYYQAFLTLARYLKAVGDPRKVVSDPEARYYGGRVEERSLVPLGEARLGQIGFDEWLHRSRAAA